MNANNQTDEYKQTIKDVCEQRQLSTQSIGVKFRRTFGTGFSVDLVPTDEQYAVLFGNIKTRKQQPSPKTGAATTFQNTGTLAAKTQAPKAAPVKKALSRKEGILLALIGFSTLCSVSNIFSISDVIMGNALDAVSLTVILACTGLGFVYAGVRGIGLFLIGVVILFEPFCNLVRVYQGFYTPAGNPTHFLTTVTDIFSSGSNATAVLMAAVVSFIIAGVQYVALWNLKRG